jgi:serine/threonine protein phosphatase PrpC
VAAPAGLTAIDLTADHKPSTPSERARIEAAGGRVACLVDPDTGDEVGPARVWLATAWAPGLAMSRSLGDALARSVGVLPAADMVSVDVRAADAFAIVATDGVWEFMSGQEAVECVAGAPTPSAGCAALVAEARRRWGVEEVGGAIDDITAIVVSLDVSAGGSGSGLDRAGST